MLCSLGLIQIHIKGKLKKKKLWHHLIRVFLKVWPMDSLYSNPLGYLLKTQLSGF